MIFNDLTLNELQDINGGWDPERMERDAKTMLAIYGAICTVGQQTYDAYRGFKKGVSDGAKAGSY